MKLIKEINANDLLIFKGQAFLEVGEYEKAITSLSKVIENDPKNKEAYFHRASAYFEMGNFDAALSDYLQTDKDEVNPKTNFEVSKNFSKALIKSLSQGAAEATIDFIPSLCSSAYGLSKTLWISAQHPLEVSKNFANSCYEMCEFIIEYCKNMDKNTFDGYIEQVKTLYENFDQLSDEERGEIIGYTIGKYGVDVFAGAGIIKGVSVYRKLRNTNRICNFEAMTISNTNKEMLRASSLKHVAERETYFKKIRINWSKQKKHIPGKNNFVLGKGKITLESNEALSRILSRKSTFTKSGEIVNQNNRGDSYGIAFNECFRLDKGKRMLDDQDKMRKHIESQERTSILANERTYAAWIRTGLTSLVTAVAIEKFFVDVIPFPLNQIMFFILMAFGMICFLLAAWRYHHVGERMTSTNVSGAPAYLLTLLSILLILMTFLVTISVIFSEKAN